MIAFGIYLIGVVVGLVVFQLLLHFDLMQMDGLILNDEDEPVVVALLGLFWPAAIPGAILIAIVVITARIVSIIGAAIAHTFPRE